MSYLDRSSNQYYLPNGDEESPLLLDWAGMRIAVYYPPVSSLPLSLSHSLSLTSCIVKPEGVREGKVNGLAPCMNDDRTPKLSPSHSPAQLLLHNTYPN